MYTPHFTNSYAKDIKRIIKRNYDLEKLKTIIIALLAGKELPQKNRDHALKKNWHGFRECHITPDWLLIYKIEEDAIYFTRTGTHSDLFS